MQQIVQNNEAPIIECDHTSLHYINPLKSEMLLLYKMPKNNYREVTLSITTVGDDTMI